MSEAVKIVHRYKWKTLTRQRSEFFANLSLNKLAVNTD
jgi:hypothetical protein